MQNESARGRDTTVLDVALCTANKGRCERAKGKLAYWSGITAAKGHGLLLYNTMLRDVGKLDCFDCSRACLGREVCGWTEIEGGVWLGLNTRVSPNGHLPAPCV